MKRLTPTTWIDAHELQRIQLAFQAHDLTVPSPEFNRRGRSRQGATVSSIIVQYQGVLSEKEVMCLISYGIIHSFSYLWAAVHDEWHLQLAETVYDHDGLWRGAA